MKGLERKDIRAKVDSATLRRMGIKVSDDEREPLQMDESRATATRTSATTSHQGEGQGHGADTQGTGLADTQGTGLADEATSKPPNLSSLKEDVIAMKEQQAQMREQLNRIESSQTEML